MASEKGEHVPAAGVFATGSSTLEWYEHLQPRGSCLSLLSLLAKQRELIHELGPKGITVLHKGVQHGCVRLVKFILVNMFDDEGYCTCRVHGRGISRVTREQLLRKACEDDITAVQMVVVSGSPKMVLLLNWAIDEVKQENWSPEGDQVTASDASRVRIRRVLDRSRGNALLFSGEEWDMAGEDMRRLFEVGNMEDCDPSSPAEVGPGDTEEEIMEETLPENVNDTESNSLVVPDDVKDHTIDCVYDDRWISRTGSEERVMIPKVYDIIDRILEGPDCFEGDMEQKMKDLKNQCEMDVDYEFVPVAHVFLHFLFYTTSWSDQRIPLMFLERTIRACNEHDLKEQGNLEGSGSMEGGSGSMKPGNTEGGGSMVATLFKILDPRGRTILHAALDNEEYPTIIGEIFEWLDELDINEMSTKLIEECMNSKDGAGRTILHLLCIQDNLTYGWLKDLGNFKKWNFNILDWNAKLSPLHSMATLQNWCFPHYRGRCTYRPIHLAILFDSISTFNSMYSRCKTPPLETGDVLFWPTVDIPSVFCWNSFELLQLAAILGRAKVIETILKQPNIKKINDKGLGSSQSYDSFPAIHCAALCGQVEAIQSILKFPIYDPIIQHVSPYGSEGTALHLLVKKWNFNLYLQMFQTLALLHVLPNSKWYARLKDEFSKLRFNEHESKMFSANEISCINLLLQAGIDIWTPNSDSRELPSPGPIASDEARKWWYDKVVSEVVTQKTSINLASNATSVIATLVATASFIGPLQPPLGLAGDGFLHTSESAVRVYFVSNGLSFYFSIASILMAVLPAIPMPKESLYDELFRSQRSLKIAALLLLVAIICILTSFTSASIAVVSSKRHDKQLVGAYVGVGGAICVAVLVVYIIRMLRMVFHKNDRFRRWFAKNMSI